VWNLFCKVPVLLHDSVQQLAHCATCSHGILCEIIGEYDFLASRERTMHRHVRICMCMNRWTVPVQTQTAKTPHTAHLAPATHFTLRSDAPCFGCMERLLAVLYIMKGCSVVFSAASATAEKLVSTPTLHKPVLEPP
jgi:acetylglutamate synthase